MDDNEGMLVILSDVWLDKPVVMTKLAKLFAGYSAFPPTAFVFMGNFASEVHSGGAAAHAKALQVTTHHSLFQTNQNSSIQAFFGRMYGSYRWLSPPVP